MAASAIVLLDDLDFWIGNWYVLIAVVVHLGYCVAVSVGFIDVLPSSLSESAGVDFRHLSDNVPLAVCKFPICALEAFLFRPMAGNEDDECFQGRNLRNL